MLVILIAKDEPTFEWKFIFPFHDLFIVRPRLTDAFTYYAAPLCITTGALSVLY